VLTRVQRDRLQEAETAARPVFIVTPEEALENEREGVSDTKTWRFTAKNVRDFAWGSSRKFIWDAKGYRQEGAEQELVMAMSYYPKEGGTLWSDLSTEVVIHTLEVYSRFSFDFPYPTAISLNAGFVGGMEYPMITFNGPRTTLQDDGSRTYSLAEKRFLIGVVIHEVGHFYFPMIVNSDERQWTWMDEGINTYLEILAELDYDPNFITGNLPKDIVGYMSINQNNLSPIMSQGDYVKNFGPNAYTKPAAGLYMLRQTIMGPELFDYAFRTYSQRWMFKHPSPADFFRTMEDASAMDLDWFWRGWFYTTDYNDIALKEVKKFYLTDQPTEKAKKMAKRYSMDLADYEGKLVYFKEEQKGEVNNSLIASEIPLIKDHIASMSDKEKSLLKEIPNYFYEVTFEKPGGLVMPLIVELEYNDGTKERHNYPAQIWRYNDKEVSKVFKTTKEIKKITIDPDLETADIDTSNNSWPKKDNSKFNKFRKKLKG